MKPGDVSRNPRALIVIGWVSEIPLQRRKYSINVDKWRAKPLTEFFEKAQ